MKLIQWRCKEDHKGCEGKDWQPYKEMPDSDAEAFMRDIAPNSKHFVYRVRPE